MIRPLPILALAAALLAAFPAGAQPRADANAEIRAWFECARRVEATPPGLRILRTDAEGTIHYAVPPGLRVFGERPILLTSRQQLRHSEVRRAAEPMAAAVARRWPDAVGQGHPDLFDFHLEGGWAVTVSQRSRSGPQGQRRLLPGASITCAAE